MKIPTRYLASLPERAGRAGAALLGGAVYQLSETALPEFVRRSKLYEATVARLLRITIELLGDVHGVYPDNPMTVQELTIRKAAGNVVEFASVVVAGWSPLWLLAGASDAIGSSKVYLRALVEELERIGLLLPHTDISSFEELLSRLEETSGVLADAVDVPPLNVNDLRASWRALQSQATDLPSPEGLASIFAGLQEAARQEGRSLLEVSTLVGLGAARAGIRLGDVHVFDYYRRALRSIAEEGLLAFLRRISSPYLERAGKHFDPAAPTYTERLLELLDRRRARPSPPAPLEPGGEATAPSPIVQAEGASEAS